MNILELYDYLINDGLNFDLIGEIFYDSDGLIKWEYDGLGKNDDEMNEHLHSVYESDKEMINDFLFELNCQKSFFINKPQFDESYVYFNITEK